MVRPHQLVQCQLATKISSSVWKCCLQRLHCAMHSPIRYAMRCDAMRLTFSCQVIDGNFHLFDYYWIFQVYAQGGMTDVHGRSVTMQSISSSLKVIWHMVDEYAPNLCLVVARNHTWNSIILIYPCRKQWIRKTLWRMLSIISIHNINNTLNTAPVSDPMALFTLLCISIYA